MPDLFQEAEAMRFREIIEPNYARLRDVAWNEAQLTLHAKDEHILLELLQTRGDGEIVERHARCVENVSTVYVRCADNDSAGDLMEAWAPHLPSMRSTIAGLWLPRPALAHSDFSSDMFSSRLKALPDDWRHQDGVGRQ